MTINMGFLDRALRLLGTVLIAVLYFTHVISGAPAIVLAVVAAIFLVTGLTGWCGTYALLHFSTRRATQRAPAKTEHELPIRRSAA